MPNIEFNLKKEDLIIQAEKIIGNYEDAYALVNSLLEDDDKFGDIKNFTKRFKCWQFLRKLSYHIQGKLDARELEKIEQSSEMIYMELLKLTNQLDDDIIDSKKVDNTVIDILKQN